MSRRYFAGRKRRESGPARAAELVKQRDEASGKPPTITSRATDSNVQPPSVLG